MDGCRSFFVFLVSKDVCTSCDENQLSSSVPTSLLRQKYMVLVNYKQGSIIICWLSLSLGIWNKLVLKNWWQEMTVWEHPSQGPFQVLVRIETGRTLMFMLDSLCWRSLRFPRFSEGEPSRHLFYYQQSKTEVKWVMISLPSGLPHCFIGQQWFSVSLVLWPFNTIHVVVTPSNKVMLAVASYL